jgi:hypothetical protein
MYVQRFVKGIAGKGVTEAGSAITWAEAQLILSEGHGLVSNWWRNKRKRTITPSEVQDILTEYNLDRHIHDYHNYGHQSPFISLASGCVERDTLLSQNFLYSAVTTALDFATDAWSRPGALFYGWIPVALNPAVPITSVAEEVRNLNLYHRWSVFQLEGEVTAKVSIPANQIELVEWWDGNTDRLDPIHSFENVDFVEPTPITNVRDYF